MPDPRKDAIKNPDSPASMAEFFGFSGRVAAAAAAFFLLSEATRLDALNRPSQFSLLTPAVVTAAHKLVDDMLNDVLRLTLMGSAAKNMSEEQKREVGQVLEQSLTSGTPTKTSKIDRFLGLYGLSLDTKLVRNLKWLCNLRDAVFHDDAPARSQDTWRAGVLEIARFLSFAGDRGEDNFFLWVGLVEWCEQVVRRLYHDCPALHTTSVFNDPAVFRGHGQVLQTTSEDDWLSKRGRLLALVT
jgi:hypothetical protein